MTIASGPVDRIAVLRAARNNLLEFCRDLTDEQWQSPSMAAGWRVQDVIAHIGSGAHTMFTPSSIPLLRSQDLERANDVLVEARRRWHSRDVLAEYELWTDRSMRVAAGVVRTPLARIRIPLGELGRFPLGLVLTGAAVFDQYTHLHFDIAPALGQTVTQSDPRHLDLSVEWMLAVLGNQLKSHDHTWLDRRLALSLLGPGGGDWSIEPDGSITEPCRPNPAALIVGRAKEFPEWGTRRCAWRERNVTISGDQSYAETFLDTMNIV